MIMVKPGFVVWAYRCRLATGTWTVHTDLTDTITDTKARNRKLL